MVSEWHEVPIGLLAEIFDGPHATPAKTSEGPIFLGISNLAEGRLDLAESEHLSEEDFQRWTRRVTPQPNDIVFSYETRLGEAALIPSTLRCCLGRRMGLLRSRPGKVDPRFLLYAYLGPEFQETLRARTIPGSTVDRIPLIEMAKFPIRVPSVVGQQRAIAQILGSLDDKIELNQRMNKSLEMTARALFKSWLEGLDPVRVKIADLISCQVLEVGDGYRAKNSELGKPGLPFIRAGDLNNGFDTTGADFLKQDSVDKVGNKICRTGDVAFTSKGTIGRFARVTDFSSKFVYSPQVCFWRSLDPSKLHPSILYCWMQSEDLTSQIAAVAGQTDMAPYVSLRDQRNMDIPAFPNSQVKFAQRIEPLLHRQALIMEETRNLATIRDTLLPKLISGEIRVKDAERFVEANV